MTRIQHFAPSVFTNSVIDPTTHQPPRIPLTLVILSPAYRCYVFIFHRSVMTHPPNSKPIEEDAEETSFEPGDKPDGLLSVRRGAIRAASPDPSIISNDDSNNVHFECERFSSSGHYGHAHSSSSATSSSPLRSRLQWFWIKNKGLAYVLVAQFFGAR